LPAINEILLIPHTHHDIGYTHVPDICTKMHVRAIREAMRLVEADGDDSSPAALRWTVELSRPLLEFLHTASSDEIERFKALVERGRMAVTAGYLHMTQLIGHEEYVRYFQPVREIRDYGLPVSVVQHGDINGLSRGVVPLMREAGLDTLVMALNPDHGRAPFEQPSAFIWEGEDGSQVLVWLSLFYSLANNTWEIMQGHIDKAVEPLQRIIRRLEERDDYPFDFFIGHAAEDNMYPNALISDGVRQWNEQGIQPPIRLVTVDEAMARVRPYRDTLPVVRGEWVDWWAHGHGSSAYEVGISRTARANLRAAEAAAALYQLQPNDNQPYLPPGWTPITNWYRVGVVPPDEAQWQPRINSAYDDLLLFEEHTWGSFESFTYPHSLFTLAHWQQKANFAYHAASEGHDLARETLAKLAGGLPAAEDPALVVFNPLSTPRSDLVTVRTPGQDHGVFVADVPPLGIRVLPWNMAEVDAADVVPLPGDNTVENEHYKLVFDPFTGAIISLQDKAQQKEWVDTTALAGIGSVVYESVDKTDTHPAVRGSWTHFHPDTPGPRFVRTVAHGGGAAEICRVPYGLTIRTDTSAPFLPRIETTIALYDAAKWIDVSILIDKVESYEMEGVYVLFPFLLDSPSFLLESANTVFQAGREQLPDTCQDWYSIQHGVGVTDGSHSVLWAAREAPLVQLGEFQTGKWARELEAPRGHIYSWLMNNLYFTNFKAAQGGQMRFSFRFTTQTGGVQPQDVRGWGEAFANPPLARLSPVQVGSYEWLEVTPSTVTVQALTASRCDDGSAILRLKECAGQDSEVTVTWKGANAVRMARTTFLEDADETPVSGDGYTFNLKLNAHELATVRISRLE
jgi:hypothetical protein